MEFSGVSCEARLPMQWQAVAELPAAAIERGVQINAALLRTLAGIEAVPAAAEDSESHPWTRLEAKVDLALALLGKLLQGAADMPEAVPLTLAANGIEWLSARDPGTAQGILISLWLHPKLPQPLLLPARVTAVAKDGPQWRMRAEFQHLDAETREELERMVFRLHRRAIQARHGGG